MSDNKENRSRVQQYIEDQYGELDFSTSMAFLSTKDPVEIIREGVKERYYIPETLIEWDTSSGNPDLVFGAGGIGRAAAIADEVYLVFVLSDKQNNILQRVSTKLPDMNKNSREKAKVDREYHGALFSINGSIPNFPLTESGILSMGVEFYLNDPKVLQLVQEEAAKLDEEIDNPSAVFSGEMCRIIVQVNSAEV